MYKSVRRTPNSFTHLYDPSFILPLQLCRFFFFFYISISIYFSLCFHLDFLLFLVLFYFFTLSVVLSVIFFKCTLAAFICFMFFI